jgi:hypothetical protein
MPESLKVSATGAACLAVTVCLLGPALVYYGNADEFELFFVHAAAWLVPAAIALAAAVAAACQLVPGRWRPLAQVMVTALAACAWLQCSVLTWDYGMLDGTTIRWNELGRSRAVIDALVWTCVPGAALLARRALGRRLLAVNAFLTALQLATIGALALPHLGDAQAFKRYRVDRDRYLDFSSRRNVIVLVLDAFQSEAFERILQARPALGPAFEGFTFYRDAAGGFPTTYPSVPLILTGQYYDNTRPIQEFIQQAYRSERSLPSMLRRAGFRVDLYPLIAPQSVSLDPSIASSVRPRLAASWAELSPLVRASAFRELPHLGKRLLAPILLRWRSFSHRASNLAFAADVESAPAASAPEPVFKYLHLSGAHAPYELNEALEPEALGSDLRAYERQAAGVVALAVRFLRKLREIGAYDNALIFILGDHGHDLGRLPERGTPLMLLKVPGARGPLQISDAPASLVDVPLTAADALGLPTWDDPHARSLLRPAADRSRRFLLYSWEDRFWARDVRYLPPMAEYLITGPATQGASWTKTGWRFADGKAIQPEPYAWGTELWFGQRSAGASAGAVPASTFLAGTGWWTPEDTHTWSKGRSSLQLPIEPPAGDLELEATVWPFVAPSIQAQAVSVQANGVEVATWHLSAPGTVRARIPEPVARAGRVLRLTFIASSPRSPAELGLGADDRQLGLAFVRARVSLHATR